MKTSILFLGIGAMGAPMAMRLLEAGYTVYLLRDRGGENREALVDKGAVLVNSVQAGAQLSTHIITMLPSENEVEEVLFLNGGVVAEGSTCQYVLDMSTIDPASAIRFHERLKPHNIEYVDAPVSGGPSGARAGQLAIMTGATQEQSKSLEGLFGAMSRVVHYLNEIGAGQVVKACNNLLVGTIMLANIEALTIAESNGISRSRLRDIVLDSSGSNWQLEHVVPQTLMASEPAVLFRMDLLVKDLGIGQRLAHSKGAAVPVSALVTEMYRMAAAANLGTDFTAAEHLYRNKQSSTE